MEDIIARDYGEISSAAVIKRIVRDVWENFKDGQWDKLIERVVTIRSCGGAPKRYGSQILYNLVSLRALPEPIHILC